MSILENRAEQSRDTFGVVLTEHTIHEIFMVKPFGSGFSLRNNWQEIISPGEPIKSVHFGFNFHEDPRSPEDHPLKHTKFFLDVTVAEENLSKSLLRDLQKDATAMGIKCFGMRFNYVSDIGNVDEEQFGRSFTDHLARLETMIRFVDGRFGVSLPVRKLKFWPGEGVDSGRFYELARREAVLGVRPSARAEQAPKEKDRGPFRRECVSCGTQYYIDESLKCPGCGDSHPKLIQEK
jgi:hypothetical protein